MEKGKRILSLLLSAILVLSMCVGIIPKEVQAAEEVVNVYVKSDKNILQRGDTVTLTVGMKGNKTVTSYDMCLTYNSTNLELQGEPEKGSAFKTDGGMADINSSKAGEIHVISVNENPVSEGVIFTAAFKVKDEAKGSIDTDLDITDIIDENYKDISHNVSNNTKDLEIMIPATGISLNKEKLTLNKGAQETLVASVLPEGTSEKVQWSSDAPEIATVDGKGVVTAIEKGTAVITATAGGHQATCKVTVKIALDSITIQSDISTIKKGQTAQLRVLYNPENTTDDKTVTWSSSGICATVDQNGLVTAVKDGVETITAEVGNKTATYDITVKEVPLQSISIKNETLIHKGEEETLEISYNPEDTTDDRTASWESSDTAVATVDGSGKISAVGIGSAVITAKVGNTQGTCNVTVDAPLEEIIPDEKKLDVIKNQTGILTYKLNPEVTTETQPISFESSDEKIMSIDAKSGSWIAHKAGTAVIRIHGGNNVTAEVPVTVTEIPIDKVTLDKYSAELEKGTQLDLSAVIGPDNNTDDTKEIMWSSSDESIVKVSANSQDSRKAIVTAPSDSNGGWVEVKASAWNGICAVCRIFVPTHIESISLEKNVEINRGSTDVLELTVNPKDTTDDTTVTWEASDTDVVSIDSVTGMITGLKEGTSDITATTKVLDITTNQPFTATVTVTVKENHLEDDLGNAISFNDSEQTVLKNQQYNLKSLLNLETILEQNQITDDITIDWSSSDEGIMTVDTTGTVVGVSKGTAEVTALITATAGNGNALHYTVKTKVTVMEIPLESIAFDKVITEMKVGESTTLNVIYNPENTTDLKNIIWSSSDPSVISVDQGVLKALKAGTAEITAQVGDKRVSCKIVVKEIASGTDQKEKSDKNQNGKGAETGIKTGDANHIYVWVTMLLGSLIVVLLGCRKSYIDKKY